MHVALRGFWLVLLLVPGMAAGQDKLRVDVHGDPLPPGALARIGSTRLRHAGPVSSLAFTRDGKVIASASHDRTICFWDAATGKLLRRLEGHRHAVFALALSPDGKRVATAESDGSVWLWDTANGKLLWCGEGHNGPAYCVAFSPDSATIASGGLDAKVRLWDAATGKQRDHYTDPADGTGVVVMGAVAVPNARVFAVAFSPDGKTLATGGQNNAVRLWDVKTGKKLRELRSTPAAAVHGLAWSPDGKRLAAAHGAAAVHLWDAATGKLAVRADRDSAGIEVAFSRDGKRLAVCPNTEDGQLRILDADTGRVAHQFGIGAGTYAVALAPDGQTAAAAGRSGGIRLWAVATGKDRLPSLSAATVARMALARNGRWLASANEAGAVRLHDTVTGASHALTRNFPDLFLPRFSADSPRVVVSGSRQQRRVTDWVTGKEWLALGEPRRDVPRWALSRDGRTLVLAMKDRTFQVWDVVRGKKVREIDPLWDDYLFNSAMALSPDGSVLAITSQRLSATFFKDPPLELWETGTGKRLRVVNIPFGTIPRYRLSLTFSPDGRSLVAADDGGGVCVLEAATGGLRCRLPAEQPFASVLALSEDGRTLAVGSGYGSFLFDPIGEEDRHRPTWPEEGGIVLWDLAGQRLLGRLHDHRQAVQALAFAADGRTLASQSGDGTAVVWAVPAPPTAAVAPLTPARLKDLWAVLAGDDAAKAYAALWKLAAVPKQALPLLRKHLRPVAPVKAAEVAALPAGAGERQVSGAAAGDRRPPPPGAGGRGHLASAARGPTAAGGSPPCGGPARTSGARQPPGAAAHPASTGIAGTHRRRRGAAVAADAGRRGAGGVADGAGAGRAAALRGRTSKGGHAMKVDARWQVWLSVWLVPLAVALSGPAAAQQPRTDVHGDALPPGALRASAPRGCGTPAPSPPWRTHATARCSPPPAMTGRSVCGTPPPANCYTAWRATPTPCSPSPCPPTASTSSPPAATRPCACGRPPPASNCGAGTITRRRCTASRFRQTASASPRAARTARCACGTRPPARNCANSPTS